MIRVWAYPSEIICMIGARNADSNLLLREVIIKNPFFTPARLGSRLSPTPIQPPRLFARLCHVTFRAPGQPRLHGVRQEPKKSAWQQS